MFHISADLKSSKPAMIIAVMNAIFNYYYYCLYFVLNLFPEGVLLYKVVQMRNNR